MRFAHVSHHILQHLRGEAARVLARVGADAENQTLSEYIMAQQAPRPLRVLYWREKYEAQTE